MYFYILLSILFTLMCFNAEDIAIFICISPTAKTIWWSSQEHLKEATTGLYYYCLQISLHHINVLPRSNSISLQKSISERNSTSNWYTCSKSVFAMNFFFLLAIHCLYTRNKSLIPIVYRTVHCTSIHLTFELFGLHKVWRWWPLSCRVLLGETIMLCSLSSQPSPQT